MKSTIIKYSFAIAFLFVLIACSVKKDKFINRNFHAVTTEYNVLYNGNVALDKGLEELKTTYQDNFWEILPIERVQRVEKSISTEQSSNKNFERAEEKATKAIQKHSMNIGGMEKNPQMDEAYLLLAKARYYDNRYIPSLEALNYILYKYPLSDRIYHAKVWREKVNIRLDNEDVAIKNLKLLLKDQKIEGQDLADAHAMLAEAYIKLEVRDSAVTVLKVAKEKTKNNEEKARYTFILGQLYESLNQKDSAYGAFQEVIEMNRRAPRRYVIQSHAKLASQLDYTKGDTLLFVEKFNKLLEDRENSPFLDVLNHQMALFYNDLGIHNKALLYYNKSLKAKSQDTYLVASNYRNIGEIYFKNAQYKEAGKYYDSTLLNLKERTREYRKIKKKRDNLDDVIKYEAIAQQNDSILKVVAMNVSDRKKYYEDYIFNLKVQDEIKAKLAEEKAKKEVNLKANSNSNTNDFMTDDLPFKKGGDNTLEMPAIVTPAQVGTKSNQSNFYFYNPVAVELGKREFQTRWGKRTLADNWRLSSSNKNSQSENDLTTEESQDTASKEAKELDQKYNVQTYLDKIPEDQEIIANLEKDRNFAYYQLGLIYKEKFKEYELAASRLEQLLLNNPEERLVLPSLYNLFKIYQLIAPEKAARLKQQILSQYPESRYAQIINNPKIEITDQDNPEIVFKQLYKIFENNQLREVTVLLEEAIIKFTGEESLPKFEMLKAKVSGRTSGLDEYKKALNFVALTYPNAQEGKQAEKILKDEIPSIEALDFGKAAPSSFKLVFPKKYPYEKEVKNLMDKISNFTNESNIASLKISEDIYSLNENFIVVHGFESKEQAASILGFLQTHKDYKISDKTYVVSTEDYKIIQMKKKMNEWILLNK